LTSHHPQAARSTVVSAWRIQFVLLAATWGSSFMFIKVLDRHWPALWVSFGRVTLGALTLVALTLWRRERLPFGEGLWRHLFVNAALFNAVPFTLYAFGEQHVPSVLAGLWNATTPLWVLLLALAAFPEEHPTRARAVALGVGFLGVVLLLGPWRGVGGGAVEGQLACAGAAASYGVAFLYTRRYLAGRAVSGIALSAAQLLCADLLLALCLPLARVPSFAIGFQGIGSILALGVFGSGVAYALNYSVLRAAGATVASTVTYLIPVVATVLGVLVLGESPSWNQPVGAAILLLGIAISQRNVAVDLPERHVISRRAVRAGSRRR
jgi:drug/metabolite transporter (DMT)-like permease